MKICSPIPFAKFTEEEKELVSEGLEMKGDLGLRRAGIVNGKLKGRIFSNNKVVVGEKAVVEGEVACGECQVLGKIKGNVRAEGKVAIAGRVHGGVFGTALEIFPNARVEATFDIGNPSTAREVWRLFRGFLHRVTKIRA